ncbi:unnamed protein product [Prunus armeniaca]
MGSYLGSTEKPKALRSGRSTQAHWGPEGQLKRKRESKKKSWTIWDQLRNRRCWGPGGQLKRIGVWKVNLSTRKKKVMDYLGSIEKPKALGSKRSAKVH